MKSRLLLRCASRVAALLLLATAGCSSNGIPAALDATHVARPNVQAQTQGDASASLTLAITVPPHRAAQNAARRTPDYVSSSTQSLAITVSGTVTDENISTSSSNCTTSASGISCTFQIVAEPGAQTISVSAFDQPNATGNILSDGTTTATIVQGQVNTVSITLNPHVAGLSLSVAPVPACVSTSAPVTLAALDADGNTINGSGTFQHPVTLSVTSGKHVSLSTTSVTHWSDPISLNYDGKSPGSATISATSPDVNGGTPVKYAFAPLPAICTSVPLTVLSGAEPTDIVLGSDGAFYFTLFNANAIGRIDPANPQQYVIATPPLSGSTSPNGITLGPDDRLYYADTVGQRIVSIGESSPTNSTYTTSTYSILNPSAQPDLIATGTDGNIWFTDPGSNSIGQVNLNLGVVIEFPIPTAESVPFDITSGPDGNLWFTEFNGGKIGKITSLGLITEYAVPMPVANGLASPTVIRNRALHSFKVGTLIVNPTNGPLYIDSGADGALHFTYSSGAIGTITTSGTVTTTNLSTSQSQLADLKYGADGMLWFLDSYDPNDAAALDHFGPTGALSEGEFGPNAQPLQMVLGSDSNFWMTDPGRNAVESVGY